QGALGILYERHLALVFSDCRRLLRDPEAARDLSSDAFLRVMQRKTLYSAGAAGSFPKWLRTIARNLCMNYLSSFAVSRSTALDECPPLTATVMTPEFDAEWLEQAIEKLSDEQRVCIRLRYIEQASYDEIVVQTGLSAKGVKSAIQNGRLRLKRLW